MKRGLCVVWLTWLMGLCLLSAADEVTLESAGARAVFDRARNGILTDFGLLSRDGRLASLLHSVQPVFHYADPEFGVCWAHLGGPEKEFGRIHPERAFKVEAMGLQGREWRVVAVDHYVRVEQRSQFVEGTPGVELRYHLDTLRDMQQSSWCTLASLRFRNTAYERFFPTHRVEGGVIRPVTLKIENVPFLNVVEMRHWFVVRDGATNEGLLVLFPGLTGRAFIQNDMSYLSVTGPYTEDKFAPKGETCDYTVWLVPFRGEFQATLQAWSQRLRFDASPSVQPAVSPTGAALAETDEVLVWHEVPSRKALGQEAPPPRKAAGVRLAAAQGEYEPFQLVIRGKEQMPYTRLERMEIEVADLKRQGGGEIASGNVTCAVAEFVDLRYPKGLGWSGHTPDALPEARRFACEPGRNTILWITVKVPRETPPGLYDGSIHLHHGLGRRRARLATVPLQVRVFGFAIPEERHFSAWLPFSSRLGIAQMYEGKDAKAIYDRYVRNYVEHRAGLRFVSPSVRFKGGSAEIEQIHLKPFEDDLRHHFDDLRMPHVNCRSFNIGASHELTPNYFGKPDEVLSPLWRARYRRLAKVIGDWLREKQWQDRVIFELFDEPVEEHIPILAECLKMLKAEFPDIRVTYAAMWVDPRLCGLVNVWMTGGGYAHIPLQKRRAAGDTLWFGNNNHASVDRLAAEFRLTWWRYWLDGIAGCNHWHVGECNDWLRKGKWDRNRIATWLLPGEDGPINTIRWELTREGLEDYEYLWLLHHAVQNAKAAGADATDGERALARVNELVIRKGRSLRFNPDPALLHEVRDSLGAQIEKLARFLPAQAK